MPILQLLGGLVYFGSFLAHNRFSAPSGQLHEVVVGDSPIPGGRERLDQLAFDSLII